MMVIDPSRHVDEYARFAEQQSATLTHVLDTHAHADHLSGGVTLARRVGARYFLHPYDGIHPMDALPAVIPFEPLWDGQTLPMGKLKVEVIHTAGHTLGAVSLLVNDRYLFSGDTLFLRSFGRPDLGGQGEAWSHLLYHTLHERLAVLSDDLLVLPGHYSRPDEANAQGVFAAMLGDLRRYNEGLTPRTEEEFVQHLLARLPPFPPEYVDIKRANLGLLTFDEDRAAEWELGKNVCALRSQ
jgi:glyoxylase-like metal-dependent hydrolase (beta-lactamase superfamily II)